MRSYKKWLLVVLSLGVLAGGVLGTTVYLNRNKAAKKNRPKPVTEGEPHLVLQLVVLGGIIHAASRMVSLEPEIKK